MKLKIPKPQKEKLKKLEKRDRERIRKKLREIDHKISDLEIEPSKVIEKRMTGRLHPRLQQRVGDLRLWFIEYKDENVVRLVAIKTKKEAEKHY